MIEMTGGGRSSLGLELPPLVRDEDDKQEDGHVVIEVEPVVMRSVVEKPFYTPDGLFMPADPKKRLQRLYHLLYVKPGQLYQPFTEDMFAAFLEADRAKVYVEDRWRRMGGVLAVAANGVNGALGIITDQCLPSTTCNTWRIVVMVAGTVFSMSSPYWGYLFNGYFPLKHGDAQIGKAYHFDCARTMFKNLASELRELVGRSEFREKAEYLAAHIHPKEIRTVMERRLGSHDCDQLMVILETALAEVHDKLEIPIPKEHFTTMDREFLRRLLARIEDALMNDAPPEELREVLVEAVQFLKELTKKTGNQRDSVPDEMLMRMNTVLLSAGLIKLQLDTTQPPPKIDMSEEDPNVINL